MIIFKLFSVFFLVIFLFPTRAQWIPHVIDSNLPHATIIDTGDIDNDGDLDIAANGSPYVRWYRNNSPNNNWTIETIDNTLDGAVGMAIRDMDSDGLLDIVVSGYNSNQTRWYRNEGGDPISWHKFVVGNLNGAEALLVYDIDRDGDLDIIQGGSRGNSVAWYENNLPDTIWSQHYIDNGTLPLAMDLSIADIDRDGDPDVVFCGNGSADVVWYNNNLPDTNWIETKIDDDLYQAFGVCTGDIDGDSIPDVAATGQLANKVLWYSTEDSGQTWTEHYIHQDFYGARNLNFARIDDDDDLDLVATGYDAGVVVWFENRLPDSWFTHTIDTHLPTANGICTADINEDGELDVLATGRESNLLIWYENIRKRIYPVNTHISKPYMIPSYDTLIITTKFSNFYQHNFTANAICTRLHSSDIDSLILYDDGLHGDSLSNDGIWGALIYPFADEDFFSIGISSLDLDNGQYFYKDDVVRYTTAGPVILDSITCMKGSADFYFIRPFVHNEGITDTITNAKIRLLCNDPWVPPANAVLNLPDLPPGQSVGVSGWFAQHYIDSLFPGYFNLKFEMMSDEFTFWSDTIKFEACIPDWINEKFQRTLVFSLEQNYPNPFNPTTTISWQSPVSGRQTLKVYDVLGREVATLVNKYKPAGKYEVEFDASNLSSGVYLFKIQIASYIAVKKMLLLK